MILKSLESDHSKQKLKENLLLGAELQGMRFADSWLFAQGRFPVWERLKRQKAAALLT